MRDIKLRKQTVERLVLGLVSVIFVATCLVWRQVLMLKRCGETWWEILVRCGVGCSCEGAQLW